MTKLSRLRRMSRHAGKVLRAMQSSREQITSAHEYEAFHEPTTRTQLEASLEMLIHSRNDPRARLEVFRLLPMSTLYCLTTPLGRYDPLDIKPQLFSFDDKIAVPLFTSLKNVNDFARRHQFCVRGPDGDLWVDGTHESEAVAAPTHPVPYTTHTASLNLMPGYEIKTAKPIFLFGMPTQPHLVGCFGAFPDVMQHVDIYPVSVDIVLNAGTPLHWSVARDVIRTLQKDTLVDAAMYHDVAAVVCMEFSRFFRYRCDEVVMASSVVMPIATPEDDGTHAYHPFRIAIMVMSDNMNDTHGKVQEGLASMAVLGHPSVVVVELQAAPLHYSEMGQVFYERDGGEGKAVEGAFHVHPYSVVGSPLRS